VKLPRFNTATGFRVTSFTEDLPSVRMPPLACRLSVC
jgi:hypothetical protein